MVFSARGFGQQADCLSMVEKMLFEGGGCVPWGFANEFLQTRNLLLSHVLEKEVRWNAVQAGDAISDVTDMVSSMGGIDMLPHVGISKDAEDLELSHGSRSWQGYQIGITMYSFLKIHGMIYIWEVIKQWILEDFLGFLMKNPRLWVLMATNNGVRYSGYGVGTVGFGGANTWYNGSTKAYGNPIPSAGYASSPLVAPRRPWSNQTPYGYGGTRFMCICKPWYSLLGHDHDDDYNSNDEPHRLPCLFIPSVPKPYIDSKINILLMVNGEGDCKTREISMGFELLDPSQKNGPKLVFGPGSEKEWYLNQARGKLETLGSMAFFV
ncbi:hypothetical protein NE237_006590 [Protea cynaroides]|uniref:Uncharacterized protein n=1 Tax=Protea cynaroides TaxID=273540 RepID=A0A9Q0KNH7_9MAGN|nr:hypothetical protein NE237_006590 [Protea cynaroides]